MRNLLYDDNTGNIVWCSLLRSLLSVLNVRCENSYIFDCSENVEHKTNIGGMGSKITTCFVILDRFKCDREKRKIARNELFGKYILFFQSMEIKNVDGKSKF